MRIFYLKRAKTNMSAGILLASLVCVFAFAFSTQSVFAQTKKKTVAKNTTTKKVTAKPKTVSKLPKVTQVDITGLKNLLKRGGESSKPLLINFWATWCDPCREEFPDLVKLDQEYKGKIDFITISLDDLDQLNTGVPKFLAKMKAGMPAYLLKTADEEAAIVSVAKDWSGGLPFTILFDSKGSQAYFREGKITEALRKEIDKIVTKSESKAGAH